MLFTTKVDIYQATESFEHGEVSSGHARLTLPLYCHVKFDGQEQMSGDRKQAIRKARLTFELTPVTLTARDILRIEGAFYRLLFTPIPRFGLSNRRIYEVDVIESFNVEVT